ncbi:3-phosphoinositide-dependent protein kinase 1 [Amphibalanus amphitrite]|uniref:3-phosphoinositide-dependent protein kinase 1 n=1 Tax=Amphibalanus amphitrite TaxID=1232801 RepID=A0A6A4WPS6_AMPAM|nr:3-phosphoinositide-dependent protein kinase 1 [Amphibalanus amphitrite]
MHIKISDFGSAKMMTRDEGRQLLAQSRAAPAADTDGDGEGEDESDTMAENERPPPTRRNSFVGTAEYVSPELLQEKTTSHASDLWALGCVVYQMVAGLPPFRSRLCQPSYGSRTDTLIDQPQISPSSHALPTAQYDTGTVRNRSQYMIFKKILALDYVIPPEGFSVEVTDLIQKLLVLEPWKRLGADDPGTDYPSLKAHPFFAGVEFTQLHEQTPPVIYPFLPGNEEHGDLRSSYRVPDDLEPGLSDRQLTQVLLNSMSLDDWQQDSASPPASSPDEPPPAPSDPNQRLQARAARNKRNIADVPEDEAARRLAVQERDNKWHRFVEGHLILKQGLIDKRKGLFARRRMFLLTLGPHLYYVDPVNMVLKGEIPWSRELRPEVKNFKHFFVHTPGRTYYLEDTQGYALEWVKAIEEVRVHTYGSD